METLSIVELAQHKATDSKYTAVEVDDSLAPAERYMFFGTQDGQILYLWKAEKQAQRKPRVEEMGQRENKHAGGITVLKVITGTASPSLGSSSLANSTNILASGSSDRSVRLWSISDKILIQKLFGHDGTVSNICDGCNGSIISCSIDGSLKVWSHGNGRGILKYPFFECVFTHKYGMGSWLQSLGIKYTGAWSIFVGDSEGGIDVWRSASSSIENMTISSLHSNYIKVKSWSNVHRLRINSIYICQSEGTIATLGFDCYFKVLNASTGQLLFSAENSHNCMYTGIFYIPSSFTFYLVDELGTLELFSTFKECKIGSLQLAKVSNIQFAKIVQSHQNPALGLIMPYQGNNKFLCLDPTSGVVSHLELKRDIKIKLFKGRHENPILHTSVLPYALSEERRLLNEATSSSSGSVLTKASVATASMDHNNSLVSREEALMFSWDEEGFVCWDEMEIRALYNIRKKMKFPISCAMMFWKLNTIVTGHDDGHICLYNIDSGSKVVSKALGESVSSLCLANSRRNEVLLGTDYDGNIAMWNLTLFKENPFVLSCEMSMKGFHDPDDPGILEIVFHAKSGMCYSCGNDATIQCWSLTESQHSTPYIGYHADAINRLILKGNALLSSDMTGVIILWRVEENEKGVITPLVRWMPGESGTFGVAVDMSIASLGPGVHSPQELDVYIARAEKIASSYGKAFVHRIRVGRVVRAKEDEEMKLGKDDEEEDGKSESKLDIAEPILKPIFTYPDDLGVESICETLQPCIIIDLINTVHYDEGNIDGEGEPSCISLLPIDSVIPDDGQLNSIKNKHHHHHYQHYHIAQERKQQENGHNENEILIPAPNALYLGRSTGSVYRFEL